MFSKATKVLRQYNGESILVSSRKEAKRLGKKFYSTGNSCKHGHIDRRYTSSGRCVSCKKEWDGENAVSVAEYKTAWRKRNPEKVRESSRTWYANNVEYRSEYWKQYSIANRDHIIKKSRQYRKDNPAKVLALVNKRRAARRNAIPKWANMKTIERFYEEARDVTLTTGIEHVVDHIISLRGKTVCGLHCENNLQVISAKLNRLKSNKMEYSNV